MGTTPYIFKKNGHGKRISLTFIRRLTRQTNPTKTLLTTDEEIRDNLLGVKKVQGHQKNTKELHVARIIFLDKGHIR